MPSSRIPHHLTTGHSSRMTTCGTGKATSSRTRPAMILARQDGVYLPGKSFMPLDPGTILHSSLRMPVSLACGSAVTSRILLRWLRYSFLQQVNASAIPVSRCTATNAVTTGLPHRTESAHSASISTMETRVPT